MQVIIKKCFFLNLEINLVLFCLVVFEKNEKKTKKNAPLIPKNEVTESR